MHDPAIEGTPRRRPRRRLAMAAVVMAAGLILVSLVSGRAIGQAKASAKKQTATVVIRIKSQAPSLPPGPPSDRENDTVFRDTQLALIKSDYVILPALRSPKVAGLPIVKQQDDPVAWLESLLKVEVVPNTELVKVSVTGPDPSQAVTLVNTVVEAYLQTVVEDEHQTRVKRLEDLMKLYERYKDELRSKREFIRRAGNDRTNQVKRELEIQDLRDHRREGRKIGLQKVEIETRLTRLKAANPATVEQVAALETTLAILDAQERYLKPTEEKALTLLAKMEDSIVNLKNEQNDIDLMEQTLKNVGEEIERITIDLKSPRRITLISMPNPL